jgi:hypothetical protein
MFVYFKSEGKMIESIENNTVDVPERRDSIRKKISIPIRYRSEINGDHVGQVYDISNGGMFFESNLTHQIGEFIQADIDLEVYGRVVWAKGNVVHASERGTGVSFISFDRLGINLIMDMRITTRRS